MPTSQPWTYSHMSSGPQGQMKWLMIISGIILRFCPPCACVWSAGTQQERRHRPNEWWSPSSHWNTNHTVMMTQNDTSGVWNASPQLLSELFLFTNTYYKHNTSMSLLLTWQSSSWRAGNQRWRSHTRPLLHRYELHTSLKADTNQI